MSEHLLAVEDKTCQGPVYLKESVLSVSCEVTSCDPLLMYSRCNFIAIFE